jgi:hypothetical protein
MKLDFDATDDVVHGNQEGRHFSAFYQPRPVPLPRNQSSVGKRAIASPRR